MSVYIYIYIYIFETVLRQFRGRALLCENAVLGTCYGEHGGCVNICRKVHEAVPRQFRGRALLCNDEVLGTCDGEHGFLHRVSNNIVFIGILGIRGPSLPGSRLYECPAPMASLHPSLPGARTHPPPREQSPPLKNLINS
jgi:hypothetical protein